MSGAPDGSDDDDVGKPVPPILLPSSSSSRPPSSPVYGPVLRKASALGGLSLTLLSSFRYWITHLFAAIAAAPKSRSPSSGLELLRDTSWKTLPTPPALQLHVRYQACCQTTESELLGHGMVDVLHCHHLQFQYRCRASHHPYV